MNAIVTVGAHFDWATFKCVDTCSKSSILIKLDRPHGFSLRVSQLCNEDDLSPVDPPGFRRAIFNVRRSKNSRSNAVSQKYMYLHSG